MAGEIKTFRDLVAWRSTQHEVATSMEMLGQDSTLPDLRAETDRVLQGLIRSPESGRT